MIKKNLAYENSTVGGIYESINDATKYEIDFFPADAELGDGIVLALNKAACLEFAKIFAQLATNETLTSTHLHFGYTNEVPQGPGFRIELTQSGTLRKEK